MDKVLHLILGFWIAVVFGFMTRLAEIGLVVALFAGLAKELWDSANPPHKVELVDFFATAIGGVLGWLVLDRWTGWRSWELVTPFSSLAGLVLVNLRCLKCGLKVGHPRAVSKEEVERFFRCMDADCDGRQTIDSDTAAP